MVELASVGSDIALIRCGQAVGRIGRCPQHVQDPFRESLSRVRDATRHGQRAKILERRLRSLPGGDAISAKKLARLTELRTGADLDSLCERAAERALGLSLDSGEIHKVSMEDFVREIERTESTALEWLSTARSYARYANEGGQYDELAEFLRKVKRW